MGRKSQRIGLYEAEAIMRGRASEKRVEEALETLKQEGEIHDYYQAKIYGELDMRGIDFQVYPEADWLINLQVKSSLTGKKAHRAESGDSIPCVVVHDAFDDRQVMEEVKRVLGLSIEAITLRN